MSKDSYYFSHDSNAFNDPKIIRLRAEFGLAGYGFYFAIIELLRNQFEYCFDEEELEFLHFHLQIEKAKAFQMLNKCFSIGLLTKKDSKVFSESLLRRMKKYDEIRKKRSQAGKKGGRPKAKGYDLLKQTESKIKALKERKGKENKENIKKTKAKKDFFVFEEFRKLYPGTKRGGETEFQNFVKKHQDWQKVLPDLLSLLKTQISQREGLRQANQFVPEWKHLQTWINQRCWEDEYITTQSAPPQSSKYREGF